MHFPPRSTPGVSPPTPQPRPPPPCWRSFSLPGRQTHSETHIQRLTARWRRQVGTAVPGRYEGPVEMAALFADRLGALLEGDGSRSGVGTASPSSSRVARGAHAVTDAAQSVVSRWRQKDRLRTTAVSLVLCLNIGVDPPDVMRVSPYAFLECWLDPSALPPQKALEATGKALTAQYERWQPRAKYRLSLDPTFEDVKKLGTSCRRSARQERVLFHYNGHGVPKPTVNGEVWVFNKSYTQYIPLSVYDLQSWVGTPSIYVLDCSAAGLVVNAFKAFSVQRLREAERLPPSGAPPQPPGLRPPPEDAALVERAMRGTVILAACEAHQTLPQNAAFPADLFTACLTTPIKTALKLFCRTSLLKDEGLSPGLIDRIPGKHNDRKTLLGELNWIFTAVTDTIAWNVLPRQLFQKLFRQDLLVASLFRNFLLAERVMHGAHCTPISYPPLPPTYEHHMWQAWDLAAEMCLVQLPALLSGDPNVEFQASPFFNEQLTAFEVWLEHGSADHPPPEQLPIVLQVLLSQSYRLRALVLLGRFLDMGSWAVELALSVGIFPYVLKLLQATATELRQILVFIWTKILALDRSCQTDLAKDSSHLYFIKFLEAPDPTTAPDARAGAAFVLASICNKFPKGQMVCASTNLLHICLGQMQGAAAIAGAGGSPLLLQWLCLCMAKLWEDSNDSSSVALREEIPARLTPLVSHGSPEVRAAAVYALGTLIQKSRGGGAASETTPGLSQTAAGKGTPDMPGGSYSTQASSVSSGGSSLQGTMPTGPGMPVEERMAEERRIGRAICAAAYDGSPSVRYEAAVALARFSASHMSALEGVLLPLQKGRAVRGKHQGSSSLGTSPQSAAASSEGGGIAPHGEGDEQGSLSQKRSHSDAINIGYLDVDGAAEQRESAYTEVLDSLIALASDAERNVADAGIRAIRLAGIDMVSYSAQDEKPWLPTSSPSSTLSMPWSRRKEATPRRGSWDGSPGGGTAGQVRPGSPSSAGSQSSSPGAGTFGDGVGRIESWVGLHLRVRGAFSEPREHPHPIAQDQTPRPSSGGRPPSPGWFLGRSHSPLRKPGPSSLQAVAADAVSDERGVNSTDKAATPREAAQEKEVMFPVSRIFEVACAHFQKPLLVSPSEDAPREENLNSRYSESHARLAHNLSQSVWRCRKEKPRGIATLTASLETESMEPLLTIAFDPLRPYLYSSDARGGVRVHDLRKGNISNSFVVAPRPSARPGSAGGGSYEKVTFLHSLNDTFTPVLFSGSSDGTVRVWHGHDNPSSQRIVSSFSAIPVPQVVRRASTAKVLYSVQSSTATLFSAGGVSRRFLHIWDVQREICTTKIDCDSLVVSAMAASQDDSILTVGYTNGTVACVDFRTPNGFIDQTRAHAAAISGIAVGEGDLSHRIASGCAGGEIKFHDRRAGQLAVSQRREVQGTAGGPRLSMLRGHPRASVFASASGNVVSVWNFEGQVMSTVKYMTNFLSARQCAVQSLAFDPLQYRLAAGGVGLISVWA